MSTTSSGSHTAAAGGGSGGNSAAATAAASAAAAPPHLATPRALFRSGTAAVLAVYDARRGAAEGREADKVLAFHPAAAAPVVQSSVVGLAQALTMFAGTFNRECPFHTMEAGAHLWGMLHAEPDLWLLVLVGRALVAGPGPLPASLAALLRGLHATATLLHGPLSAQLEQDPSGARVRRRLQPLLQEAAGALLQPERGSGLWPLASPLALSSGGGVPLLPVSHGAFARVQSLANGLQVTRLCGRRPVLGVLFAWRSCVLWSSLSSADTAALQSLVARGLEPAAREAARPRGTIWAPLTGSSPQRRPPSPALGAAGGRAPEPACLTNPACWHARQDGLLLPLPAVLERDAAAGSSVGGSGSIGGGGSSSGGGARPPPVPAAAAGAAAAAASGGVDAADLPVVWLQAGSERARLLAWHSGPLLVLLLLECSGGGGTSSSSGSGGGVVATTGALLSMLHAPGAALAAQLAGELPPKQQLWHVRGLRYRYEDGLANAARASPLRKVGTLSSASLALTADARRWAALEAVAAADPTAATLGAAAAGCAEGDAEDADDGASPPAAGAGAVAASLAEQWEAFAAGGADADVEVVVRGANDAWVVGRRTGAGRALTAVVEEGGGGGDRGGAMMLGVLRRVGAFCDAEVPGVFDGLVA